MPLPITCMYVIVRVTVCVVHHPCKAALGYVGMLPRWTTDYLDQPVYWVTCVSGTVEHLVVRPSWCMTLGYV